MKSSLKSAAAVCLFTLAAFTVFTSCFPDTPANPSVIRIGVRLNDIDSTFTSNNDSLTVNRVRLIHGFSFFKLTGDSTLTFPLPSQLSYPNSRGTYVNLILNSPFPERVYEGLTFKIVRAKSIPDSVQRFNPDAAFTDGGNYSVIVSGTFNSNKFTLKVPKAFSYDFNFTPAVTVGSGSKLYQFLISANMESWFSNDDGNGFLNPTVAENDSAIYNNISQSFTIEQLSPE